MKLINYQDGGFYNADCFDAMRLLPDGCVDLCVTSPPYDNLRDYNGMTAFTMDVFKPIAQEITRLLKPGAVIVWNVADATVNGSETGTSFRQALYFKDECGLNLHDTMIFEKAGTGAAGSRYAYWQTFEYMFVFSKGRPAKINLIKDKENLRAGNICNQGRLKPDGSLTDIKRRTIPDFSIRTNIWRYGVGKAGGDYVENQTGHPAVFPRKLAVDHIISWSDSNDVVLDPFAGSGTTAVAARNTGRRWICIERDETYFAAANARLV